MNRKISLSKEKSVIATKIMKQGHFRWFFPLLSFKIECECECEYVCVCVFGGHGVGIIGFPAHFLLTVFVMNDVFISSFMLI